MNCVTAKILRTRSNMGRAFMDADFEVPVREQMQIWRPILRTAYDAWLLIDHDIAHHFDHETQERPVVGYPVVFSIGTSPTATEG